jgi:glycine cleavage system aminomethyltransferase T/glycine/D-amino acid oxidase-like deaminating enzyme
MGGMLQRVSGRRFVIVGAGIVGVGLADELAQLGERNVTVLEKGSLGATGGSTFHAPGLVSRTSTSKFLADTAAVTIDKFRELSSAEGPALPATGTLEVAYNAARLNELWRRHDAALAFGWSGRMIEPDEAVKLWPIINSDGLLGAFSTRDEGLAAAGRAVDAMTNRARSAGIRFVGETEVSGFDLEGGVVRGVRLASGETVPADLVVCCAGVWTTKLARLSGITLPVLPMEHQYAITEPVPELGSNRDSFATMPILRHHDIGIYFRDHGDRVGIGSFHHRGMPVRPEKLDSHPRNLDGSLAYSFTEPEWSGAWELVQGFMPALKGIGMSQRINGVFGFTPDGYPVVGEHPEVSGLWFAASIWITHSQGVARMLAQTLVKGCSQMDMSPADLSRFDEKELEPDFFEPRSEDQYRDVYVAHHPAEPATSARGIRFSPFVDRQRELGAEFFNVATWERPQWFGSNPAGSVRVPSRDEWSSRHWSPVAIAEHLATRDSAGVFDMTPLYRIEVTGEGSEAFLLNTIAARTDRDPGSVVYSVMLDGGGGIRSDVTVTRLGRDLYWVCGNGPRDIAWLRAHAPRDGSVGIRYISDEVGCLGLWGPAAREILSAVTDADLGNPAFPYMSARNLQVQGIDTTAVRISYAGELGWELTCQRERAEDLWDAIWKPGEPLGLKACGRAALGTLRLEKGYRAWGSELSPEHGPQGSGLGRAVRTDGSSFIGKDALERGRSAVILRCLLIDDEQSVMGSEAVVVEGRSVGYVTSGAWCPSIERSVAYAWVDGELSEGDRVEVWYFDRRLPASLSPEPLFDPAGSRLRG